jgi:hypothetical protein
MLRQMKKRSMNDMKVAVVNEARRRLRTKSLLFLEVIHILLSNTRMKKTQGVQYLRQGSLIVLVHLSGHRWSKTYQEVSRGLSFSIFAASDDKEMTDRMKKKSCCHVSRLHYHLKYRNWQRRLLSQSPSLFTGILSKHPDLKYGSNANNTNVIFTQAWTNLVCKTILE